MRVTAVMPSPASPEEWGSLTFGGPLATAGGLTFIAAGQDDRFRAFAAATDEQLWEARLPAGGNAAPMTYRYEGRQYVVIAAGGRGGSGRPETTSWPSHWTTL